MIWWVLFAIVLLIGVLLFAFDTYTSSERYRLHKEFQKDSKLKICYEQLSRYGAAMDESIDRMHDYESDINNLKFIYDSFANDELCLDIESELKALKDKWSAEYLNTKMLEPMVKEKIDEYNRLYEEIIIKK